MENENQTKQDSGLPSRPLIGCAPPLTTRNKTMQKEFFAVFIESRYHVEGDERSRTTPGHGYPAHSVEYTEVKEFQTESELKSWILENNESYSPSIFRAVKCFPVSVSTKVEIEICAE